MGGTNPRANSKQGAPGASGHPQTPLGTPKHLWDCPKASPVPPSPNPRSVSDPAAGSGPSSPQSAANRDVLCCGDVELGCAWGVLPPEITALSWSCRAAACPFHRGGQGQLSPPRKKTFPPSWRLPCPQGENCRSEHAIPSPRHTHDFFLGVFCHAGSGVTLLGLSVKLGIGWAPH